MSLKFEIMSALLVPDYKILEPPLRAMRTLHEDCMALYTTDHAIIVNEFKFSSICLAAADYTKL